MLAAVTLAVGHALVEAGAQRPASPSVASAGGVSAAADPEPSARIVRLDAIVTDRQGRPIRGLKPSDFEVVENGVSQKIDAVEERGAALAPEAASGPSAITSLEEEQQAARERGTRLFALFLDEFHVSPGGASARVRDGALRFLEEQVRPSDLVVVLKPLDSVTDIRFTRDRAAARRTIEGFNGRRGDFTALTEFEEKYIGRAPAAVQAARAQIVFSGLRALTMKLGELEGGRSAVVLVTEGFVRTSGREHRRVPDVQGLVRAASRHNISFYTFDPGEPEPSTDAASHSKPPSLRTLAEETGGEALTPGSDLVEAFRRVGRDLDGYYLLSYTSSHGADGRFYDVQVRATIPHVQVRARTGYWAPLRSEFFRSFESRPAAPVRAIRRSPLIDTWLGLTVAPDGTQRVIFTWEPSERLGQRRAPAGRPSTVGVKVTTTTGAMLYEGEIRTPRATTGPVREEAAVFDAAPGRIQIDLIVFGADGSRVDTAAHDIDVPDANRADPVILPPQIFRSSSAREFREISADPLSAPVPSRRFRRTERLLLRVPTHSPSGASVAVTARVLNRIGQVLREIRPMGNRGPEGAMQFDLPLAWLAPGEYTIELSAKSPAGVARELVRFTLTG